MERKTYVIGLFISSLSQLLFFGLAFYHSDETGRSWILFHREHWIWALFLSIIGLMFIVLGVIADLKGVNGEERIAQKTPSIQKPQKIEKEQLEDLEAQPEVEEPTETGAPKVWEEEEFE